MKDELLEKWKDLERSYAADCVLGMKSPHTCLQPRTQEKKNLPVTVWFRDGATLSEADGQ